MTNGMNNQMSNDFRNLMESMDRAMKEIETQTEFNAVCSAKRAMQAAWEVMEESMKTKGTE